MCVGGWSPFFVLSGLGSCGRGRPDQKKKNVLGADYFFCVVFGKRERLGWLAGVFFFLFLLLLLAPRAGVQRARVRL
jgi:hypothetical protein